MGIRLPLDKAFAVVDIRCFINGEMKNLSIVKRYDSGVLYTIWEQGQTTFFDINGNVILDKNGMPFQGKKQ